MDFELLQAIRVIGMCPVLVCEFWDTSNRLKFRKGLEKVHGFHTNSMMEVLNRHALVTSITEIAHALDGVRTSSKLKQDLSRATVDFIKLISSLGLEEIMEIDLQKSLLIGAAYASLSLIEEEDAKISKVYRESVDLLRTMFQNSSLDEINDMRTELIQVIKKQVVMRHRSGCSFDSSEFSRITMSSRSGRVLLAALAGLSPFYQRFRLTRAFGMEVGRSKWFLRRQVSVAPTFFLMMRRA